MTFETKPLSALAQSQSAVDSKEALRALKALQSQIDSLTLQVEHLKEAIEESADAVFTDEQSHHFTTALAASFKTLSIHTLLSVYSSEYFKAYPRNLRLLIATELVNEATLRVFDPSPFWHSLIANNGSLV